jgi:hypothetical protein
LAAELPWKYGIDAGGIPHTVAGRTCILTR